MSQYIIPNIGQWYINVTGQLIKVIMVVHSDEQIEKVIIKYLNGDRKHISIDDWNLLNLSKKSRNSDTT